MEPLCSVPIKNEYKMKKIENKYFLTPQELLEHSTVRRCGRFVKKCSQNRAWNDKQPKQSLLWAGRDPMRLGMQWFSSDLHSLNKLPCIEILWNYPGYLLSYCFGHCWRTPKNGPKWAKFETSTKFESGQKSKIWHGHSKGNDLKMSKLIFYPQSSFC